MKPIIPPLPFLEHTYRKAYVIPHTCRSSSANGYVLLGDQWLELERETIGLFMMTLQKPPEWAWVFCKTMMGSVSLYSIRQTSSNLTWNCNDLSKLLDMAAVWSTRLTRETMLFLYPDARSIPIAEAIELDYCPYHSGFYDQMRAIWRIQRAYMDVVLAEIKDPYARYLFCCGAVFPLAYSPYQALDG